MSTSRSNSIATLPDAQAGGRLSLAADHNVPEPVLASIEAFLPFDAPRIRNIDQRLIENVDDWQVILALRQRGLDGLITLDYSMLELPRELAVIHQTQATVVTIEATGHSPLQAIGELMVHAPHIARVHRNDQPQIYRIAPRRFRPPASAWDLIREHAEREGVEPQTVFRRDRLTDAEIQGPILP